MMKSAHSPNRYNRHKNSKPTTSTSWEKVSSWYDDLVGKEGHYYHKNVILPKINKYLRGFFKNIRVLDCGCGQGVLSQLLHKDSFYLGLDAAHSLLEKAKDRFESEKHQFQLADLSQPLDLEKNSFDIAFFILSLQNMASIDTVIKNISSALKNSGEIYLVLNHPCFRIPQHSDWGEEPKKGRFRKVFSYLSKKRIPIKLEPSKGDLSRNTYTFQYSLSYLMKIFAKNDLAITQIEEWTSPKKSTGRKARIEDYSRDEIPLFMQITLQKQL